MIIACPKCQTRYQLKDGASPEKVRCKKCQEVFDAKSCVVADAGTKTVISTPPPAATPPPQSKTVVTTPKPPPPAQAAQKTVVPPSGGSAAQKTVVPPAAGTASQKTVVPPTSKPTAQARTVVGTPAGATPRPPADSAGTATVVPPKASKPAPPSAEMKTVAPQQAAEMKTVVGPSAATPAAPPDELVGKTLGGYEILRKLGQGGMGAVYEARQVALDRSVALKVLPADLADNKSFIVRFTREALAVAKLNHNNIIQIYDVGKADGTYFFSMEFVRGMTLQKMVEKQGKLDPTTAVGYIMQAARGLEYAHRKNIIHRDIKPDNIMINDEGVAKVADLGLAKDVKDEEASVTMSGVGMGTPHYMAPEQATDAKRCDQRADIYSLGCTLYHLVAGRVPYDGSSAFEIITKHVQEPITLPHVVCTDVPESLSHIIGKMMGKKKEERYNSMAEVVTALEEYLGVNYAQKGFQPTEDQIATLRGGAEKYAAARKNMGGKLAVAGMAALVVIIGLLALSAGWRFILALVEFAVFAPAAYFVLSGFRTKSYAYRRARNAIFALRLVDWVAVVIVTAVVAVLSVMFNLLPGMLIALVLGAGVAMGYYVAFARPMRAALEPTLEELRKFARDLRRKGIPEEEIQLFICRDGGAQGEDICAELFSYEAALATRAKRTAQEVEKRSFSAKMHDRFIAFINRAEAKRGRLQPAAAGTETHAAEEYLAHLDERPSAVKSLLVDGPRFLISPSGRITIGAIMLLLAAISWKGFMFKDSAALGSLNYALFSFGILVSGFTRSRMFLIGIGICCLVTGPLAIFASGDGTWLGQPVSKLVESYPILGQTLTEVAKVTGQAFVDRMAPPFIIGALALIAGFVAHFFVDW